jgi:hypothetical protein
MTDQAPISQDRLHALERRVMAALVVAALGAGLGVAGLYVGLRSRPSPTRLVIESAEGRMVLTPTDLRMHSRDGARHATISIGSERLHQSSIELSAGEEASIVRLASTSLPARGEAPARAWADLQLGGVLDDHVRLDSRATDEEGPRIVLEHRAEKRERSGSTTLAHGQGGPRVTSSIGGVTRSTVLQLGEGGPPAPGSPVASGAGGAR